jgi:hypothetical protein
VQVKFEEGTKENLIFSLESYEKRLEENTIDNKISELTKKLSFVSEDEKYKILEEIQKLTQEKNKN